MVPDSGGFAYPDSVVDARPYRLSTPALHYPEILRQAGISGQVMVAFVVDTMGHTEGKSIRILSSTNQLFEQPACDAIMGSTFLPGRISDRAVRVRVEQTITFTVQRSGKRL